MAGKYIEARLLLESGPTSPIVREEFVKEKQILTKTRKNPISIWNASQQPITGAGRYYTQPIGLEIGNHSEVLVWEVGVIEDSIDGTFQLHDYINITQMSIGKTGKSNGEALTA